MPSAARHIDLLDLPPDADAAFLAEWEATPGATLYRALRPDARFRFVAIAEADGYEVVHEDGTPDGEGGVVLINPFEVPGEADERFLAGWEEARAVLAAERGYMGTRLHRSPGEVAFRFVNLARWSSPLAFAKAVQRPGFQRAAGALAFASYPALYQVVRRGR